MNKPNPDPPPPCKPLALNWTPSPNKRTRFAGDNPAPESTIATTNISVPSRGGWMMSTRMVTFPCSLVNLMAFERIFLNTVANLHGSTLMVTLRLSSDGINSNKISLARAGSKCCFMACSRKGTMEVGTHSKVVIPAANFSNSNNSLMTSSEAEEASWIPSKIAFENYVGLK